VSWPSREQGRLPGNLKTVMELDSVGGGLSVSNFRRARNRGEGRDREGVAEREPKRVRLEKSQKKGEGKGEILF